MEEDKQHSHLARKETRTSSQAEEISSSPHKTHIPNKEPRDERDSSVREPEHPHHHSAQPKTSTTSNAAISSMTHAMTNYNINV